MKIHTIASAKPGRCRTALILAGSVAVLLSVQPAFAATTTNATWTGGGGVSTGWNTLANWASSLQPDGAGTSTIHFAGATSLAPVNDYGAYTQFNQILFDSGASSFNLSGNAIKLNTNGGSVAKIQNDSFNTLQTVSFNQIVFNSSGEFNPVAGDLTINNSVVFDGGGVLSVYGNNGKTLTLGGILGNGAVTTSLINQNINIIVLNAANTYSGNTTIKAGELRFGQNGSSNSSTILLGDTANALNAKVTLSGTSAQTLSSAMTVQAGNSGTETLQAQNTSGTTAWNGAITLNKGLTVAATNSGGILQLATISASSSQTILIGDGSTTNAGIVSLAGSSDNTNVGATVNSGTLLLAKVSTSLIHAIGTGLTINIGGTVQLGGSGGDQIFNSAGVTVNTGGTLDLNAQSETIDALSGTTGIITNNATGTSTLTTGGNNGGGTYSGVLQNGGSLKILALSKQGNGNLTLSGASTYSGGTTFGSGNLWGTVSFGTSSTGGPGSITSGPLGSGTLTINGSSSLNNIIQSTDVTTRTISNAITFLGSSVNTTLGGTGDLIFDGTINLAAGTRTFTVSNTNTTFSGVVSGNSGSGLTKGGTGTLILSGNNGYSGTTTVNAGILNIRHSNALGAITGSTSVSAGAAVQMQGGITVGAEALSLMGNTATPYSGTDLVGALRNISGTNTYGGAITLASQAAFGSDAGTLNLTNTINNGGFRLIVVGAGDITMSNVVSGAGDLLKQDAGTLTVTGNNSFGTATNAVFMDKGTIQVGTGGTLGTTNGTSTGWVNMSASVAGRNGDTFLLARDAGLTIANAIDSRFYATDVPGIQTIGGLNATGTTTFSGAIALHDNVNITSATGGTVTFSGQIQNGSLSGLNNQTTGQALVGGTGGGLTLNGTGTVIFSNSNTYVGTTAVSSGALTITNNSALGTTAAGTSVASGAVLRLDGTGGALTVGAEALTLNGIGLAAAPAGALRNIGGNNSWAGAVTLGSASSIQSDASTLTLSGGITNGGNLLTIQGAGNTTVSTAAISGAGGLTKLDGGTLALTAANTYTGATTVNAGTLKVDNNGTTTFGKIAGSAATNSITVNNGGTLLLAGTGSGDRVNDAAGLTLAGGTLSAEGVSGSSETMGALTLSANSTIDFGTGNGNTLTFSGLALSTFTLSIYNWSGNPNVANPDTGADTTQDRLLFTTGGFNAGQLSQISFYSGSGSGLLGTGREILFSGTPEIVPVPEPTTIFGALALVGLAGYRERRRISRVFIRRA